MGEEENKPGEEKMEEPQVEEKKTENPAEESKDTVPAFKEEGGGGGGAAPLPAQEIVMKVYMHCEGCARKFRRCLKGFEGVEDVITDCKSNKVIVKGEKTDPLKVVDRLQMKSHRQVELISPILNKPTSEEKKKVEDEKPKPQEPEEEPKVITVILKVYMHCEACAQEIKKRIQKMKGVEKVEADLKSSEVTVKGVFDPQNLVEYVHKRTGKHAVIVKKEEEEKKEEKKEEEKPKEEEKGDEGEKKEEENNEEGKGTKDDEEEEETKIVEVIKRNEYNYYHAPPIYGMELYSYPPQIFSDENPNACSIA